MLRLILSLTFISSILGQSTPNSDEKSLDINIYDDVYRTKLKMQNKKFVDESNRINGKQFILDSTKLGQLNLEQLKSRYANLRIAPVIQNIFIDNIVQLKKNLNIDDNTASNILKSSQGKSIQDATPIVSTTVQNTVIINIDWVVAGKVTPIRDQGKCGSCYTFSTLAGIQSAYLIKNNMNLQLSNQQLVDCSTYDYGCNGGWMSYVLNYVKFNGSSTTSLYPYTSGASGITGAKCKVKKGGYKISSWFGGFINSCASLTSLLTGRPVIVAATAGNQYFAYYSSGILSQCGTSTLIDHAILVVGVYQDSTLNYWKIKNSWGNWWGQSGFMRLNRNVNNICSICSYGFTATV